MREDLKMKTQTVHVRLTEDELATLDERRSELGITRSEFIRFLINADIFSIWLEPDDPKPECYPYIDAASIKSIKSELVRQGVNLNQAAHRLNTLQHYAVQGKASGLDWRTYTNLAERNISEARDSLASIKSDISDLRQRAGYDRGVENADA